MIWGLIHICSTNNWVFFSRYEQ